MNISSKKSISHRRRTSAALPPKLVEVARICASSSDTTFNSWVEKLTIWVLDMIDAECYEVIPTFLVQARLDWEKSDGKKKPDRINQKSKKEPLLKVHPLGFKESTMDRLRRIEELFGYSRSVLITRILQIGTDYVQNGVSIVPDLVIMARAGKANQYIPKQLTIPKLLN